MDRRDVLKGVAAICGAMALPALPEGFLLGSLDTAYAGDHLLEKHYIKWTWHLNGLAISQWDKDGTVTVGEDCNAPLLRLPDPAAEILERIKIRGFLAQKAMAEAML